MDRIFLSASLALSAIFTGCQEKEAYPVEVPVSFLLPVTITPSKRAIERGDTLWLEANFPDSLLDQNSGRRFRVRPQDLNLHSSIFYEQLTGISQRPTGIASSFRIVEAIGTAQIQGSFTSSFIPMYDGNSYRARIGLIPTRAGVAAISLLLSPRNPTNGSKSLDELLPFIELPKDSENREQKAVLTHSFYVVNEGKANNFDLYQQYTRAFSLEPSAPPVQVSYETKSTFTVEVK